MTDPISKLRSATRRAKSDVANKLVSMCLHEMSRKLGQAWPIKIESEEYAAHVRERFGSKCPYCLIDLTEQNSVIEHLDGMNRIRVGLHVPGNVLVACKRCNSEKRRDDSLPVLTLAPTGWESFLSHDGLRCTAPCRTCHYWETVWTDEHVRKLRLTENKERIRAFRGTFSELQRNIPLLMQAQPALLAKLYTDCQAFAEREISALLKAWS